MEPKSDPQDNWRVIAADQTDEMRAFYGVLHDLCLANLSIRNALSQVIPQFPELFDAEYAKLAERFSTEESLIEHILEKRAGQLRKDPYWKEVR